MSTAATLVKSLLPNPIIVLIQRVSSVVRKKISLLDQLILRLVVRSPLLSSLYYTLISAQFRYEQQAVIAGKLMYYTTLASESANIYLLRRNIHRLEKGLIMQPRRDVFAVDYIEETVNTFLAMAKSIHQKAGEQSDLKWPHDVLQTYFDAVSAHPVLDRARTTFLSATTLLADFSSELPPQVPYKRNLDHPATVSYEDFLALCQKRRSVRWYRQEPVPRAWIDQAVKAAMLSPSACNRQPFEFRIFDQPELVQQVATLPGGTKGFAYNFPVIVVVVGQLSAYFSERDRHIIYIDGALASMAFMYALETLGLSSCAINWPDIKEKEESMKQCLNLAPDERVIMLISLGYPDTEALVPYSSKKSIHDIRTYN